MKTLMLFALLTWMLVSPNDPLLAREVVAKIPIMLYFSRTDCHFCRNLEEEILNPLIRSGTYRDKIIIRQIVLDSSQPTKTFDDELQTPEELAKTFDVQVTPTLLFVDNNGRELVTRIVGYQKTGYYSHHLEESINKAGEELRNH